MGLPENGGHRLGDASVKYVMVDEVQDYTCAQLMVLRRYFRRAHFLLLGDENQAIKATTRVVCRNSLRVRGKRRLRARNAAL